MGALVLELQRDAMNEDVPVTAVLRKGFVIAKKLGSEELQKWLQLELNGYGNGDTIPEYRYVRGELRSYNPYNGIWMPVLLGDSSMEFLLRRPIGQKIAEIEDILSRGPTEKAIIQVPFDEATQSQLMRMFKTAGLPPTLVVTIQALVGIRDAVRTTMLDWSLKLEEQGILGEGMRFSAEEKNNSEAATNYIIHNIENFQGLIGSVTNSAINQSGFTVNKGDIDSLKRFLELHKIASPRLLKRTHLAPRSVGGLE